MPPELPAPPAWQLLAARVAAVNVLLRERGSPLSIPLPDGEPVDRDRISTFLMAALAETRDARVLELLYLLNAGVLLRFCRARLRRAAPGWTGHLEAADVVDEAFMNIFLRARTFTLSERASFTGWSLVVAENLIRQVERRRRGVTAAPLSAAEQVADAGASPVERALGREAIDAAGEGLTLYIRLCAAGLLGLPPRWRRALELREGDGLSYKEIAARMELTPGHVGMIIRRARQRVLERVHAALRGFHVEVR